MKALLQRVLRAARVVIYDPEVQRTGKALVALVAVRLAIALAASPQIVEIVKFVVNSVLVV